MSIECLKALNDIKLCINVKMISLPEQSLPLYNSYSSISPNLQVDVLINRFRVVAEVTINKTNLFIKDKNIIDARNHYLVQLDSVKKDLKKKKITEQEAYERIYIINKHVFLNPHLYQLYPTFIDNANIDTSFTLEWNINPELYQQVHKEIVTLIQQNANILFQNTAKYNVYTSDLLIQKILQKMERICPGSLENYYSMKKILLITYK